MKKFYVLAALLAVIGLGQAVQAHAESIEAPNPASVIVDAHGASHGLGYLKRGGERHGALHWAPKIRFNAPKSYDLRALGYCSPVEDQGQCGSCWAFSVTGVLESALMRAGRGTMDLSAQELVSCAPFYGCNGGEMSAMDYLVTHGDSLEKDYPYKGTTGRCKKPLPAVAAKGVRWAFCGSPGKQPTLAEIKQCMIDYGVQSVVVAAGGSDWSNGGHMKGCKVRGQNHMVRLGGWLETDELIGRNQWGTGWGDKGDFYAKQGCDELASGAESVSFIVVDGSGPSPVIPHITLPETIKVHPGTEINLGRHVPETGVTYAWFDGQTQLPLTESEIYVTPTKSTVYSVKATTAAGTAESSVEVTVDSSEMESF
jgi:hypothetical protein